MCAHIHIILSPFHYCEERSDEAISFALPPNEIPPPHRIRLGMTKEKVSLRGFVRNRSNLISGKFPRSARDGASLCSERSLIFSPPEGLPRPFGARNDKRGKNFLIPTSNPGCLFCERKSRRFQKVVITRWLVVISLRANWFQFPNFPSWNGGGLTAF